MSGLESVRRVLSDEQFRELDQTLKSRGWVFEGPVTRADGSHELQWAAFDIVLVVLPGNKAVAIKEGEPTGEVLDIDSEAFSKMTTWPPLAGGD